MENTIAGMFYADINPSVMKKSYNMLKLTVEISRPVGSFGTGRTGGWGGGGGEIAAKGNIRGNENGEIAEKNTQEFPIFGRGISCENRILDTSFDTI